jgi:hypothetical protein
MTKRERSLDAMVNSFLKAESVRAELLLKIASAWISSLSERSRYY